VGSKGRVQPRHAGPERRLLRRAACSALVLAVLAPAGAPRAANLLDADGWDLRWDNTLRYSAAFRLAHYDEALVANSNTDDGDRNFSPGLISNRLDLLSELDLSNGNFGVQASAAAWYDTIYHQKNSNDSPATFNSYSVPHNEFTSAVRTLHGEDADLLNAFAYGSFDVADMPVSFRVGRHTLLWGESLYFADNGIAAGQAPVDAIKAAAEPEAEAKELFLPVTQASMTIQPMSSVALSAYYQFEWRRTRLPGAGSYFSDADFLDAGGESIIEAPGQYLARVADIKPNASGQYGVAATATLGDVDYGLYALRFDAKEPEFFLWPGLDADPAIGRAGVYELVFPTGIDAYGASFSTYLDDSTIAGEASVRRNMPLVSQLGFALPGGGGGGYAPTAYAALPARPGGGAVGAQTYPTIASYAVGNTFHAQFSSVTTLSPGSLWDGADLSGEIAANDLLQATGNASDLDPTRTRFAAALRAVFEPKYFEVLPALDLSLPIGLGYNLVGRSSTDSSMNAGAGDVEIGVSATYHAVWQGTLTYTHFCGSPVRQPFADRDFLSISLQRTF
jgi:hypothetical protein